MAASGGVGWRRLCFSVLTLSGLVLVFQGFSVEGQENLQEILSKQLLLCQFLMALSVVRTGDVSFPSPLLSKDPLRPCLCLMRVCTGLG